jgi:pimeloyl-ACP methyl ester carboxylesterase
LRMDLSGLGDSDAHAGQPENEVFPIAALDDMRSAIEFLRARLHIEDITLCGFCSGGYHALRAAAAELPTNRILIVNPENFFWKAGADIHALQPVEVVRRTRDQRERILSAAKWKKLFTGQVDILRIVKVYAQRPLLGIESHVREWARFLRIRLPRDLGWELEAITARGAQVVFVFAQGEGGIDLLRMQAGSSLRRVGDRCRIHIIDGADHIFSSLAPRTVLERLLNKELGRSLEQPISTAPDPDPEASRAEL